MRRVCLLFPLLPLLPTLGCWGPEWRGVWGHVAFNNANDHEVAVYVRPLREDLRFDCAALAADPGTLLVEEAFGEAVHWLLPPRTNLGVVLGWGEACGAAWIGGEGIEPRIVFVDFEGDDEARVFDGESSKPSSMGPAHVGVAFDPEGRATWVGATELVHTPASTSAELPPACELPSGEQRLDWSRPMSQGRFELLSFEAGVDGCAELVLQPIAAGEAGVEETGPVETAYLCAPPATLSMSPGERLSLGEGQNQEGLRRLAITLLDFEALVPALEANGEYLRVTTYYRNAPLSAYLTRAFPLPPDWHNESSCPWRRVEVPGCATVERRIDLFLDNALVEPGVETSVADTSGSVLYRSMPTFVRERALVDPSCSGGPAHFVIDFAITLEPAP